MIHTYGSLKDKDKHIYVLIYSTLYKVICLHVWLLCMHNIRQYLNGTLRDDRVIIVNMSLATTLDSNYIS